MGSKFNPLIFTGIDFTGSSGGGGGSPTIGSPVVGADPNSILGTDSSSNLIDFVLNDGQILIGATGAAPAPNTIGGTRHQIIVTTGPNSITLSTPQNIDTTSSPMFQNLTLSGMMEADSVTVDTTFTLSPEQGILIADGSGVVTGQQLIGDVNTVGNVATLADTAVTPGVYTNANITVDSAGRIILASSGSSGGVSSFNTRTGAVTLTSSDVTTALTFTPENSANKGAANGYASLDASSLIPITQIPPAALERLVIVADQTARFALTTATVQNGDTVKQTDTNVMYFVIDQTNLNNSSGYSIYTAGTASSVAWSGITGIPAPVSALLGTNTGDVTIGTANGLSLSSQVLSLALSSTSTTGALSSTDWNTFNGKQAAGNYITALTGDATASGPGSATITLATVNSNIGTFNTLTVNAKGLVTAASNTSYEVPLTFSTGLTRTTNTITVNAIQNITKLSNLTTNGFVKTSGGDGTLSVDTNTYITGNQTITLSGDVTGSGTTAITTTLANTAVTAGSYTSANITVDAKGRITAAANGSAGGITALTGDVTASGSGSVAATIANNAVTNAKAAQMAAYTIKGNNTASTANAIDLTVTQAGNMLQSTGVTTVASSGSSVSPDFLNIAAYKITLTAATVTINTPANMIAGGAYMFELIQDGTGGRLISTSWIKWPGGVAPTLSTAAGAIDLIAIYYNGTNYYGSSSLANS